MRLAEPVTVVIFGASGDLTQRKLIPALYNLYIKGRLPEYYRIIGVARSNLTDKEFCDKVRKGVEMFSPDTYDLERWRAFSKWIFYMRGNAYKPDDYNRLSDFLDRHEAKQKNRLYYLSTAPSLYEPILNALKESGLSNQEGGWRRIVIEKPFGYDLKTACELNEVVHRAFEENQVYRIDHYLGKETAQNILFLRFANTIFEPIWNRNYVDSVQITVAESVDVGRRGGYYDQSGVLRDMFQNHLMQLLALITMEPPISLAADHLRNEKGKVLNAIRPVLARDIVRAQYDGYLQEEDVPPDSQTPTYAALKLYIDNWRWQGIPFYVRSGKALKSKTSEIAIQFRRPPMELFGPHRRDQSIPNTLSLCIQPDEGIHLGFEAKLPDTREGHLVDMEFHYASTFGEGAIPEAYERLILDALLGDAALFAHKNEIEASWRLIDTINEGWKHEHAPALAHYSRGTWGPVEADLLLDVNGHSWYLGCQHD